MGLFSQYYQIKNDFQKCDHFYILNKKVIKIFLTTKYSCHCSIFVSLANVTVVVACVTATTDFPDRFPGGDHLSSAPVPLPLPHTTLIVHHSQPLTTATITHQIYNPPGGRGSSCDCPPNPL
ncbi:unnamed protein product [Cuscuta europaea]|uniref:Uncharacterized protein n=1 Tax=Cuscuta europaea TaxID=41803 RepID=A0A9P0YHV8_CUSEU|nr:unnamed protein product [Cuscuta europaea]